MQMFWRKKIHTLYTIKLSTIARREKKTKKHSQRVSPVCVGGGRPSKIENQILKNIPAGCENVYEGVCVCGHTEKQTKKKQKAIANVLWKENPSFHMSSTMQKFTRTGTGTRTHTHTHREQATYLIGFADSRRETDNSTDPRHRFFQLLHVLPTQGGLGVGVEDGDPLEPRIPGEHLFQDRAQAGPGFVSHGPGKNVARQPVHPWKNNVL